MIRPRTITWSDPQVTAAAVGQRSGLEFVQDLIAERMPGPPLAAVLGFTLDHAEFGSATFGLEPGEEHYNPIGSVHGGVYATLLDSAAGCAVQTVLPPGTGYTSLDLTVKSCARSPSTPARSAPSAPSSTTAAAPPSPRPNSSTAGTACSRMRRAAA